jgi:hypothetical protein
MKLLLAGRFSADYLRKAADLDLASWPEDAIL